MILNIFGPSGSGKTTLIKSLLKYKNTQNFFEEVTKQNLNIKVNKKISVSLIPLPKYRGSIGELLKIFSIESNSLLFLNDDLKCLYQSIFNQFPSKKNLNEILQRKIQSLSAGEIRRLYILKSLLVDSNILIVDEPFSNSDKKLWNVIYRSINNKDYSIILTHFSLIEFFDSKDKNIAVPIDKIQNRIYLEK